MRGIAIADDQVELTIQQAADETGVPISTVRRWAAGGFVEARKVGRDWFVRRGSLEAMPRSGPSVLRREIKALVGRLRDDNNCTWIDQVPYVVRTTIVDALEDIING